MIDIIIPVYNVRPYLFRCLNSIKVQTSRGWHCIVVDDGSTDGGSDLADELTEGDSRFTVIHQPNAGLSAARNRGMEESEGDLLFIDSDDWVERTTVAVLASERQAHPGVGRIVALDLVHYGDTGYARPWNITPAGLHGPDSPHLFASHECDPGHATACLYIRDNMPPDLRFPKVTLFEDMLFNMGLMFAGTDTLITKHILYHYLRRDGSLLSKTLSEEEAEDTRRCLADLAERYGPTPGTYARCRAFLEQALAGRMK